MWQLCQPQEYNHDYVLWITFRRLNLSVKAKQILVTFCPSVLHRDVPSHSKFFVRKDINKTTLNWKSLKFQRKVKSAAIVLHIWSAKLCSISIQIQEYFTQLKIQRLVATWLLKAMQMAVWNCLLNLLTFGSKTVLTLDRSRALEGDFLSPQNSHSFQRTNTYFTAETNSGFLINGS